MTAHRLIPAFILAVFLAAPGVSSAQSNAAVEVLVWVRDQGRFVDGLALDDFEIYEDGALQTPASLHLVREQSILREEVRQAVSPDLQRNFYLLFQTTDWNARLGEAVDHLFRSLLLPGDAMTLVTPMKPYGLTPDALARRPMAALSKEMQQILRRDIQQGGGDYRDTIRELRRVVRAIGGDRHSPDTDMETDSGTTFGLEMQLERYKEGLRKLENMRLLDQRRLIDFAESLRGRPGRNFVVFFYQREFRPEISASALNALMDRYQDSPNIRGDLQDLFQFYHRRTTLDEDLIRKAFADAAMTFSFIFMNKEAQYIQGATMKEQSEDVFELFSAVARATGGLPDTSQNPASSFRTAAEASRSYYLLTYVPINLERDGRFREIEVRVKGRDIPVSCRAGYYAKGGRPIS